MSNGYGLVRAAVATALLLTCSSVAGATDLAPVLAGEMTYLADAARLVECRSGRGYPMAMEGDFIAAERAYLEAAPEPGAPVFVTLEGGTPDRPAMDGGRPEPTVVVDRFIAAWPQQSCERNMADTALVNTYWRIVRLGDEALGTAPQRREPHILLREQDSRYEATVGCNQHVGTYDAGEASLAFSLAATTMMACPPPLDALEPALGRLLQSAARWRIIGNTLELFDADGAPLALLEAVHFG